MPNFDRFGKRWSLSGVVSSPSPNQADSGFGFLGQTPPSVELFNALSQALDDKDNWLFNRITEILSAAGITPNDATQNQLLTALRTLFAPGFIAITTSQSIVVPAGVTRMKVRLWGGGGGGGGAGGYYAAGTGGGGGGYTEGIFPVTPNASIFVTVGQAGSGAPINGIFSASSGGTTSFGSFCSATGGSGGLGSNSGIPASSSAGITGGQGFGGSLNLTGGFGGFGAYYPPGPNPPVNVMGGGLGGASPFGGSLSHTSFGIGNPGHFPGGGGGGAGTSGEVSFQAAGRDGAAGLAIVEW